MKTLETIADPRCPVRHGELCSRRRVPSRGRRAGLWADRFARFNAGACALLALAGKSAEVRSRAIKTLRRRDPREIASFLVVLLRDPELDPDPILYHYRLYPAGWETIGSLGYLFVQGPLYDVLRTYPLAETRLLRDTSGFVTPAPLFGYESRVMQQRQQQSSDLAAIIRQILSESAGAIESAIEAHRDTFAK